MDTGPKVPAHTPGDDAEDKLRELEAIHLPPVEPNDPRLAIPETLRKPGPGRRALTSPKDQGSANQLMRISAVGTNFALAVVGLGLIGWALQKWLWPGTAPWLLVGGLLLGLVVGAVRFVHDAKALMK